MKMRDENHTQKLFCHVSAVVGNVGIWFFWLWRWVDGPASLVGVWFNNKNSCSFWGNLVMLCCWRLMIVDVLDESSLGVSQSVTLCWLVIVWCNVSWLCMILLVMQCASDWIFNAITLNCWSWWAFHRRDVRWALQRQPSPVLANNLHNLHHC